MGLATPDFKDAIVDVVRTHAPEITDDRVRVRQSKGAKYYSVTVTIVATSESQIMAIFKDLKDTGRIKLVL